MKVEITKWFLMTAFAVSVATAQTLPEKDALSERTVFAHYMTCFGLSRDSYKREISLAQQYGIDGWALNCGHWEKKDEKTGKLVPNGGYVINADNIFASADELGTGFKLIMSPDGSRDSYIKGYHENQALRYIDHPNLFHWNGRPVFSGWGGGNTKYKYARERFDEQGLDFCIVPSLGPSGYTMFAPADLVDRDMYRSDDYASDGSFHFACDGTTREMVLKNANMRFASMQNKQLFMAGACPAYNSSNLRDYQGVQGYIAMWEGIVKDQPELVEIVTWNDYAEDTCIMPSAWDYRPRQITIRNVFARDESFLDLTAYYSAAFKSGGHYPEITQDKLYVGYRNRPKCFTREFYPDDGGWRDQRDYFMQIHDDVQDNVYATVFLTDDAELSITQGDVVTRKMLRKGIRSLEAPMVPGQTPQFKLTRNGKVLIDVSGRRMIIAQETEENSLSFHWTSIHRVWTSATIAGDPAYRFPAKAATADKAEPVKDGVRIQKPEASLTWPLSSDFKPGSYNVRVSYRNDGNWDARLTFTVNVPTMDATQQYYHPVFIPLFLPPTSGEVRSVSFLMTVPQGASSLVVSKDHVDMQVRRDGVLTEPLGNYNDFGTVDMSEVSLIRNEIPGKLKPISDMPEMVALPGGVFHMGANAKDADELPARDVTLSPFAIGKYEITNKEFEQFRPEHRTHRTALSWRDREPVIYVSWVDAAQYCNWLSNKYGLMPAYDEKSWKVNRSADGFRLPTEAQWEYAASGRGENRVYPWGSELPSIRLANITAPDAALSQSSIATRLTDGGTAVVGSYPDGASRDGVMDMAGNVAEWCADIYHYEMGSQTVNPLDERPSANPRTGYRAIRGGSWGYYGMSQRVCDREFNNPRYPGYIYLGFRIALPEAGMKKLGIESK
jgi:formylglycine-generating enzyme required for sulfatase activity